MAKYALLLVRRCWLCFVGKGDQEVEIARAFIACGEDDILSELRSEETITVKDQETCFGAKRRESSPMGGAMGELRR